jgi:hypothetical protein
MHRPWVWTPALSLDEWEGRKGREGGKEEREGQRKNREGKKEGREGEREREREKQMSSNLF